MTRQPISGQSQEQGVVALGVKSKMAEAKDSLEGLPEGKWVGARMPFQDGLEKAVGTAPYLDDLPVRGALCGRALRSAHAHARIVQVDVSSAERIPGVHAILTAKDVPGENRLGAYTRDAPAIADGVVRCRGDVVALIAAETATAAETALGAIQVKYEPLPVVSTIEEALADDAPELHPGGNLLNQTRLRKGDVEAGLAESDVVVEGVYRTPCIDHLYLEVEGACAVPGPGLGGGSVTVWGPSQQPFSARSYIARALALSDVENVRYVQTLPGGAFGGKSEASVDVGIRAALLAQATNRAVKLVYSREESIEASSKRHASVIKYKTGATLDGRLKAVKVEIYLDKGAYSAFGGMTPPALRRATQHSPGPYKIQNVSVDVFCVHTNNPFGGQMRAPGVPQVTFACEMQMDRLAEKLGADPMSLRRINALEEGAVTAFGQTLRESVGLAECLDRVTKAVGWQAEMSSNSPAKWRRGRGVACGWYGTGNAYGNAAAEVYMTGKGTFQLAAGVVDFGQGSKTVLSQMAAEAMGVSYDRFFVRTVDTAFDPAGGSSTSSRITMQAGQAAVAAGKSAREEILRLAGEFLEADPRDLDLDGDQVLSSSHPETSVSLDDLAGRFVKDKQRLVGMGTWEPRPAVIDPDTGLGEPWEVYAFGAQAAEVEVDRETGEIRLLRVVAAHDVGRAIHPQGVEMQIEGGVYMGASFGLMEELVLHDGVVENPDLAAYLLPTALDVPEDMDAILVECPFSRGPYGAKGAGEPPIVPTAAAIAAAIRDAVGVRIDNLPITPEKIVRELKASA